MRRGSTFLCQLAGKDQRRPVGLLTNLPQLKSKVWLHWPILVRRGDERPLPGSCPFVPQQEPFRGTDAQADFVSGSSFWKLCLADVIDCSLLSLGDGEVSLKAAQPSFTVFFQLLEWFIRERPSTLPGSVVPCRVPFWRTSPRPTSRPRSQLIRRLRRVATLVLLAVLQQWPGIASSLLPSPLLVRFFWRYPWPWLPFLRMEVSLTFAFTKLDWSDVFSYEIFSCPCETESVYSTWLAWS